MSFCWIYEKFLEAKLPQSEIFKQEYLGDFGSEYPEEVDCFPTEADQQVLPPEKIPERGNQKKKSISIRQYRTHHIGD